MKFKEGDYVKIVAREVTAADAKSGLYYQHFSGLTGTVDRIYGDEICISVDPASLPEGILRRHTAIQESIRRKWLDNLSGEARHRLTPEERQFNLAYTILVQSSDLGKAKKGEAQPVAIKSMKPVVADEAPEVEAPAAVEAAAEPVAKAEPKAKASAKVAEKKAPAKAESASNEEGMSAAELAFLKEREKALKGRN